MKKSIVILLFGLIALICNNSFAYTPPSAPPNGTYVLDLANKLSQDDLNKLNSKIENLNKTTKNEYGVLLLTTMDGESIDDVAYSTFNSWGVGKKNLDNGILLVISFKERKTRIETGKGVEQDLTDLQSSDILQNVLKPQLKAGKVYDGINDTIDACSAKIESRATAKLAPVDNNSTPNNDNVSWLIALVVFGIGGLVFGIVMYIYYSNKREEEKDRLREQENLRITNEMTDSIKAKQVTQYDLPKHHVIETAAIIGTGVVAAAVITEEAQRLAEKRRREREEEDRRRRDREDEESRNRSSSSYDSGSSWGGSDSGSGFDGGGSSGGGGNDGGF